MLPRDTHIFCQVTAYPKCAEQLAAGPEREILRVGLTGACSHHSVHVELAAASSSIGAHDLTNPVWNLFRYKFELFFQFLCLHRHVIMWVICLCWQACQGLQKSKSRAGDLAWYRHSRHTSCFPCSSWYENVKEAEGAEAYLFLSPLILLGCNILCCGECNNRSIVGARSRPNVGLYAHKEQAF